MQIIFINAYSTFMVLKTVLTFGKYVIFDILTIVVNQKIVSLERHLDISRFDYIQMFLTSFLNMGKYFFCSFASR